MIYKALTIILLSMSLLQANACPGESSDLVPTTPREKRINSIGSAITGKDGDGITLYSSNGKKAKMVDQYLWQASLDAVEHMPIKVSDRAGGVISTDWYEDDSTGRIRVNIIIKPSNTLSVKVFKNSGKANTSQIAEGIKKKILARAEELKE